MTGADVAFQLAGEFYAVLLGHHDVAHDDVGIVFLCHFHAFLSVLCLKDEEVVAEGVGDVLADVSVVFHDQQLGLRLFFVIRLFFFGCKRSMLHFSLFDCNAVLLVQGVRIGVVDTYCQGKATTLSLVTLHADGSLMQFGQRFDECQSDAGARRLMAAFRLIVTFKHVG